MDNEEKVLEAENQALDAPESTPEEVLEEFHKEFLQAILEAEAECDLISSIKLNLEIADELSVSKVQRAVKLAGIETDGAVLAFIDVNPMVEYYDEVKVGEEDE